MQYTTRELNLLTTSLESQRSKSNKSFISEFYLIVNLCLNFFFKSVGYHIKEDVNSMEILSSVFFRVFLTPLLCGLRSSFSFE